MLSSSKQINIWFNRTYSTNYDVILDLKNNPDGYPTTIFATHVDVNSPVLQAADWSGIEPDLEGDEYVDWMLSFCEQHNIDVLIPLKAANFIAKRIHDFNTKNVSVMISDFSTIHLLADKNLTYQSAYSNGIPVPPWRVATTIEGLVEGYDYLRSVSEEERIVIKPSVGVGAQGFRVITDKKDDFSSLFNEPSPNVSLSYLIKIFSEQSFPFQEFILMPYLKEPEISVDCLSDGSGNLLRMVPRVKKSARVTQFHSADTDIANIVEKMCKFHNLKFLTNTQMRWWQNELVLLETNTRISGGLHSISLAGVNMAWDAVKVLLNEKIDVEPFTFSGSYTNIPEPVLLQRKVNSFSE